MANNVTFCTLPSGRAVVVTVREKEKSDTEENEDDAESLENSASEYRVVESSEISPDAIHLGSDGLVVDADLLDALSSEDAKGELRWLVYRPKEVEELAQLRTGIHTDKISVTGVEKGEALDGDSVFIIRLERKKKKTLYQKLISYAPSLIGPVIGAVIAAFLRN